MGQTEDTGLMYSRRIARLWSPSSAKKRTHVKRLGKMQLSAAHHAPLHAADRVPRATVCFRLRSLVAGESVDVKRARAADPVRLHWASREIERARVMLLQARGAGTNRRGAARASLAITAACACASASVVDSKESVRSGDCWPPIRLLYLKHHGLATLPKAHKRHRPLPTPRMNPRSTGASRRASQRTAKGLPGALLQDSCVAVKPNRRGQRPPLDPEATRHVRLSPSPAALHPFARPTRALCQTTICLRKPNNLDHPAAVTRVPARFIPN